MNFRELYYRDAYQTEFDATVTACEPAEGGFFVTLDRTCFYPAGGGAPADRGTLTLMNTSADSSDHMPKDQADSYSDPAYPSQDGTVKTVRDVRDAGEVVLHLVDAPLAVGTAVHGSIDWSFRFPVMQGHSGEHILSGLAHRMYGCENVGFHMSDVITVDLTVPLSDEDIAALERAVNEVITRNVPILALYPDDPDAPAPAGLDLQAIDYRSKKELPGEVRIIHIGDADDCACCGLHVRTTGEIGLVKVLSHMHYKGGTRLTMVAGAQAFADYQTKHDALTAIGQRLSAPPEDTLGAVERALDESREKDRRIAEINQSYFEMKSRIFLDGMPLLYTFERGLNRIEVRKFCDLLVKSGKSALCAVLNEEADGSFAYCIGSADPKRYDLKAIAPKLNEALSGQGGGSSVMIQGTFCADAKEISAALQSLV